MPLHSNPVRPLLALALAVSTFSQDPVSSQTEVRRLVPPVAQAGDFFGISNAFDGPLTIIGASGNDVGGYGSGAAYVFQAMTGQLLWSLPTSAPVPDEEFGFRVAIDGDRAVIGASGYGSHAGAVYIYDVTTGQQLFQVIPGDVQTNDYFGAGLSMDGGLIGDVKYYQCWYRNPTNPPCGHGVHDFNSSNGLAVKWYP